MPKVRVMVRAKVKVRARVKARAKVKVRARVKVRAKVKVRARGKVMFMVMVSSRARARVRVRTRVRVKAGDLHQVFLCEEAFLCVQVSVDLEPVDNLSRNAWVLVFHYHQEALDLGYRCYSRWSTGCQQQEHCN